MKTLVIHPNDPSTQFLCCLYENLSDATKLTEKNNNSEIKDALQHGDYDLFMFLGHGGEDGLYAPNGSQQFGRSIINASHVQFMRDKMCFGVWCNANMFARKYGLTGLFTGMVISEIAEAMMWNVPVANQDEMTDHDNFWVGALNECFKKDDMKEVPRSMYNYISDRKMTALEDFNFNSIWFFDKGEEIY